MTAATKVTLIALAILLALVGAVLAAYGTWAEFTGAGTVFAAQDAAGYLGYDGQFAWYIARDGAAALPLLDGPTYRLQRIGYPLAAFALALGQPQWTAFTLVAVNVIAITATVYLLAAWLDRPWLALVYVAWGGTLLALRLDTTEPLCIAWALGGVAAYRRGRLLLAAVALAGSALTKEIGLVFAAALALHAVSTAFGGTEHRIDGRKLLAAALLLGLPVVVWIGWARLVLLWLQMRSLLAYPGAALTPLGWLAIRSPFEIVTLGGWLLIPAVGLALWSLWRWRTAGLDVWAALVLALSLFVLVMPRAAWHDPVAALRISAPLIAVALPALRGRVQLGLGLWWATSGLIILVIPCLFVNPGGTC